jgi:Rps23 Pro-64 3,4-dihydroxylase Tpa1-like proline 4-hydroxylase
MKYAFYTQPVAFCIIYDYYTEDEVEIVHDELETLEKYLGLPVETGTAFNVLGKPKKENRGLFLDTHYRDKEQSAILTLNKKLFSPEVLHEVKNGHWFFRYLDDAQDYTTLVSLYKQGGYYHSHVDKSFLTAIYYTWKEPKTFEGGDICFGDFRVPVENNCLVIFPSNTEHKVTKVTQGSGRYAITQFINLVKQMPRPDIQRFTNFLTVGEFEEVWSVINASDRWTQNGKSQEGTRKFGYLNLIDRPFFAEYLLNKIRNVTKRNFKLDRVYANGQVFGQNGSFHQDNIAQNTFTFLLYMNKVTDLDNWGGETQFRFYDDQLISFQPETNSALLFDSRLWHRGLGPNKNIDDMRITIAWKLSI